jgi:response regulator of citrate/malate metabolism
VIWLLGVDVDFMVAWVHKGLVERTPGFEVVGEARTGRDALSMIATTRPDLVLLDIYLPDMSGIEVLRRLRSGDSPDVDVLIITAARDAETVRTALRGGAVHYIIKPFDSATLRERLLGFAQVHRELKAIDEPDQSAVDRVFGTGTTTQDRMPKGLTPETAELVRDALHKADNGLSATECAELIGLARVSARRYLEHFVESKQAEVRLRYGTAGRPQRRYHWLPGT